MTPLETIPSEWYTEEVRALPKQDRDRIDDKLAYLRRKGWTQSVADQSVKHLRDGIYELRILSRGAAYRLLFFVVPGGLPRVIVLTSCTAKSVIKKRARMEAEIERAKERRAMWIDQQRKRDSNEG